MNVSRLTGLKGASPRAEVRWCMKCGQVLVDDPAERELEAGDPSCTESHDKANLRNA